MDLGISTYTYTWAFGVPGHAPQNPMGPEDLIKKAFDHGLGRVQLADNYALEKLSKAELEDLAGFASSHNVIIEVGARGLKPDRLDTYLEIARIVGSPFLRFVIDEKGYEPDIPEITQVIHTKLPKFREAGIPLAIENHDRFKCGELVQIIQETDPETVGICLDTVNSFGAGEGVQEVLGQLMPYTLNFHIKDFAIRRKYHQMGFDIAGTPAGSGFLDIPQMVKALQKFGKCSSCTLELWTSPEDKLENTIEKENLWAEKSLGYLKGTGLFRVFRNCMPYCKNQYAMIEFKLNKLSNYSDENILDEIRRVAKKLNLKPLSVLAYDREGKVHSSTIRKRFGNWQQALKKAGLDEGFIHTKNRKLTKEEIIDELKRVAKELNKSSFTANEFEQRSEMSRSSPAFYREFGSFKKAMEAANLIPPIISKRYDDEERFENLLKVWTYYGRQPSYTEMKNYPSIVAPKAYVTRWGNWRNALNAFVEKINQDIDEKNVEEKNTNYEQKEIKIETPIKGIEEDRRDIKLGLRYKVLSRDNFKCVKCGDSPATNPKCKLHVDHIIPFSKGGKTIFLNLQTLCNKCNIGKGDRI